MIEAIMYFIFICALFLIMAFTTHLAIMEDYLEYKVMYIVLTLTSLGLCLGLVVTLTKMIATA